MAEQIRLPGYFPLRTASGNLWLSMPRDVTEMVVGTPKTAQPFYAEIVATDDNVLRSGSTIRMRGTEGDRWVAPTATGQIEGNATWHDSPNGYFYIEKVGGQRGDPICVGDNFTVRDPPRVRIVVTPIEPDSKRGIRF